MHHDIRVERQPSQADASSPLATCQTAAMTSVSHFDRRVMRGERVFQMSSELHRRRAIKAIAAIETDDGSGVLALPVERYSTGETLLLVLMGDQQHLNQAVATVALIDRNARRPRSG